LDRSRARATVGGGFPAPPFRLRGGFTFPPWSTFPEAPVVIPDGRIWRVAAGLPQDAVRPAALAEPDMGR
jgi:hypothetical protein